MSNVSILTQEHGEVYLCIYIQAKSTGCSLLASPTTIPAIWMDGWIEGWIYVCVYVYFVCFFCLFAPLFVCLHSMYILCGSVLCTNITGSDGIQCVCAVDLSR